MPSEAARNARELQMLETMVDCAHALGVAFGEAAKVESDARRSLELFDAFQKSFLALRMGIRLSMTLRAPPRAAPALPLERTEPADREPAERDPPEREPSDSGERERDRDYEPVSLPKFLATLGVVARDAAKLGDHLPAGAARVLPTIEGVLARATTDPRLPEPGPSPTAGIAVLACSPQSGTRRGLLGSAATSPPGSGRPTSLPWSGSG
jgi:hypothetical protein